MFYIYIYISMCACNTRECQNVSQVNRMNSLRLFSPTTKQTNKKQNQKANKPSFLTAHPPKHLPWCFSAPEAFSSTGPAVAYSSYYSVQQHCTWCCPAVQSTADFPQGINFLHQLFGKLPSSPNAPISRHIPGIK